MASGCATRKSCLASTGSAAPARDHHLVAHPLRARARVRAAHADRHRVAGVARLERGRRPRHPGRPARRTLPQRGRHGRGDHVGRAGADRIPGRRPTTERPGAWPWIVSLGRRGRRTSAQQYCPACLGEDATPHYRISWRLAWHTGCVRHGCALVDRCARCGSTQQLHHLRADALHVATCTACGADLRAAAASACHPDALAFQQGGDGVIKAGGGRVLRREGRRGRVVRGCRLPLRPGPADGPKPDEGTEAGPGRSRNRGTAPVAGRAGCENRATRGGGQALPPASAGRDCSEGGATCRGHWAPLYRRCRN